MFLFKVSTCWITNVMDVTDTAKTLMEGTIKGFVQKFEVI